MLLLLLKLHAAPAVHCLRPLPPGVQVRSIVSETLDIVELRRLADTVVGDPGSETGLSLEQRKRLSIAVELVRAVHAVPHAVPCCALLRHALLCSACCAFAVPAGSCCTQRRMVPNAAACVAPRALVCRWQTPQWCLWMNQHRDWTPELPPL